MARTEACNCVEDDHQCYIVKCECYVRSTTLCKDHSVHHVIKEERTQPVRCGYTESISDGISSICVSYEYRDCECAGICQMNFVSYDERTGITIAQDAKGNNYEIDFDDVVAFEDLLSETCG